MEMEMHTGVFVPTGTANLISAKPYKKLLGDHNIYLQSITTIPLGDFQHETLDIPFSGDPNTDIDKTTLHETILSQPWCISVEITTTPNKILLVTTKGQIVDARAWADNNLPEIYNQNIADKIDVTNLKI